MIVRGCLTGVLLLFCFACSRNPGPPPTQTPIAIITPTVTLPSPSPSPTPSLVAIPEVNLNVRAGPGTEYEVIGLLTANSPAPIIAGSQDGDWWQISYSQTVAGTGWVAAEFTAVQPAEPVGEIIPTATVTTTEQASLAQTTPPSAGLTVTTPIPAPTFRLHLTITPKTISPTECARLRYEVTGATDVRLNGQALAGSEEAGAQSDSQIVCPQGSTAYTLHGLDQLGRSITKTVTLTVLAATTTPAPGGGSLLVAMTAGCRFARLTLGTSDSGLCRFSPDGRQIAAPAAAGSLWVVETDGSGFAQLFDPAGRFAIAGHLLWSPNGEAIAFNAVGLDGTGLGAGYFHLPSQTLGYLGPDAQQGKTDAAGLPRWTQEGRLIITWFRDGLGKPGLISLLGPDSPVPLGPNTELQLSSGVVGQQLYPWQPGKRWHIGQVPSYDVD